MPANFNQALLTAVLPDAILVVLAGVIAVAGLLRPRQRPSLYRWIACIALAGAVAASGSELFGMRTVRSGVGLDVFAGGLVADHFSVYLTITACVLAFVVCLLSDAYVARIRSRASGFFALLLLATASVSVLAGQHNMITFFVALQTLVTCTGLIAALSKTSERSAGAAFGMLVEGAVAGAVVLYGLVVLYGAGGSVDLSAAAAASSRAPLLVALGVALVLLGLTYATGLLPFRRWLGRAAAEVSAIPGAFIVVMLTGGGAVAWLRFGVSGLGYGARLWVVLSAVVVCAAALYAGLAALRERNLRRLVGHLASAQAALLVVGAIAFGGNAGKVLPQGPTAALFGLVIFGFGLLAVFAVLGMLENAGVGSEVDDLRGLGHRSPVAAVLLALALGSLAGVPPLAGFIARLLIFESAVGAGFGWLVIVMLAAGALILVATARLIAAMYGEAGDERPFTTAATPLLGRSTAVACCAAVFLLGVIAQPLLVLAGGGAAPLP